MRRKVYRSLDKSVTLFGIKGRFIGVLAVLGAAALLLALVVGMATDTIVGLIVFAICGFAAYSYVMNAQGKSSDRTFFIKLAARNYPRYVRTPAMAFRRLWEDGR